MEVQTAAAVTEENIFLAMNCLLIAIGNIGGPLIVRLYFLHGGKRIWFSGCLQTAGWPIMLIPLLLSYTRRRSTTTGAKLFLMNLRVFSEAAAVGVLFGLSSYLYSYGMAKLPVSTALLSAMQLVFMAVFAFLVVNQKFTAYSINTVVLLTAGAVVLGLHASSERPEGESDNEYWSGFVTMVTASALYGFSITLVELTYKKAKQGVTYNLVMEIQLVMCFFATAFCIVGMLINNDFQVIQREAREFEVGAKKYYLVVVCIAIIRQCTFLGVVGVVFYSSSLFSGITTALCLPITQLLAVIFFNEKFQEEKGISLFLSLWGFISYLSGGIKCKHIKMKKNNGPDGELTIPIDTP
ncbi:purine permease 3 [Perilla frutescens var. hirtella]|uniref:Probable purine permease n=1 Tax=Perilla frutescens var. hirtella TaxID=608512 RepID=A0AAD4ISY2_PERFH|nr:purine permease 3 [Perilla frutescens var. hirtella]